MMRVPRFEILRYVVPVVAVALALILTLVLQPLNTPIRFPLFYLAVAFSAWLGGLGPGLLATGLSALTVAYFFLPSAGTLDIGISGLIQTSLFVLVSTIISLLAGQQKRTEESMRHQRESLRATLASIGDAVIVTDTNARVTFVNKVAERLTGWTLDEALGNSLHD